jgi:menaquinone-9 beta-reductase
VRPRPPGLPALGRTCVLADSAAFPRDKPCGDGLTPRAVARAPPARASATGSARGARRTGDCGPTASVTSLYLPWNGPHLPAMAGVRYPALELDATVRDVAMEAGAKPVPTGPARVDVESATAVASTGGAVFSRGGETCAITLRAAGRGRRGALSARPRSWAGTWHRDTVYGVAARGYVKSDRSDDPWISSHLELRGSRGRAAVRVRLGVPPGRRARSTSEWARWPRPADPPRSTCEV